ncbi:unnamed protein product [Arabis nemorensis]|uniref:Knottin scorpion toxin-like domain-containing protein n=1 Tax=Arabis nemorensis TaxID=586526 RepID=A0A565CBW7_9BRAS|nr:unnamed protein product [Arabis nemorensis]
MAKLSYLLVLMFVFSAFSMVQRTDAKRCQITIEPTAGCILSDCRLSCYSGYNGVGKCFDDPKVPGRDNCGCLYNC